MLPFFMLLLCALDCFLFLLDDFLLVLAALLFFMPSLDMLSCVMVSLDLVWSLLSCFMLSCFMLSCFMLSCANMLNEPASMHMANILKSLFFIAVPFIS